MGGEEMMAKKRSGIAEMEPLEAQSGAGNAPDRQRFNVTLSNELYEDMVQMSRRTNRTMSELVRLGLGILFIGIEERTQGNKLVVADKDNRLLKELVLPK